MEIDAELRSLTSGAKEKDANSARLLYEHLVEKVFPFVRGRVGTQEDALDITQDVFVDFFKQIDHFTYQTPAHLYAYVFVIARRKLARHYATAKTVAVHELPDEDQLASPYVESGETRTALALALERLEPKAREIIELHHFSRFTFGEIALMLGEGESAVRVAHHRALAKLRELYTDDGI
jgi:RNA polymerase sigma-70 factor, ECF subfamily